MLPKNIAQTIFNIDETVDNVVTPGAKYIARWTVAECFTPLPAGFIALLVQSYLARRSLKVCVLFDLLGRR